ncbi:hypothetical protein C3747_53g128 [Trypanosoma cruzi]|uniref:Uncharacterized protein n=2 Tax=Trypanosoma cruzi TaxID=5693 RepID=Q4DDE4_TRYCC|nr:hypothetical protein, conserved [Trypanosoma cruzi]EAN90554.1 hypothetical protein, conserved [Trypanosoma cruzi]PWV12256.1 hypothetical protein C3747_53g128 [Trypanosoma cruzi]RNC58321.1 hypothetical protein TcCL_ESM04046 [Trypanosoma cruzi]|eukprot:XP_812405.1 hypothetical protein [Trypanosoma cruzi strain CL Brener]
MGSKCGLDEVPRQLRQLLHRIPVGYSSVYLNELQPSSQHLFLAACMTKARQKLNGSAENKLGISVSRQNVSFHPSVRASRLNGVEAKQQGGKSSPSTSVPMLQRMVSELRLPKGSSGRLEAYRTSHPTILTNPHLFLLIVPRWMFDDEGGENEGQRTVESVLQRHLVKVNKTLYWREGEPSHGDKDAATDTPDVMLETIWGCTTLQLCQAAKAAASRGCRLFLLSYPRQRMLSNEGLLVRELGGWCPSAFCNFQLDVRSVDLEDASRHSSSLSLLEEAQRGFGANIGVEKAGMQGSCGSDSTKYGLGNMAQLEYKFPFAVAEAVVDAKRDAPVPWAQVCDDPLTASLFEALYDRRHFCVADAVLYASRRVVLPFLLGLSPSSSSSSNTLNGTGGGEGGGGGASSAGLMRWSEIHAVLRWRLFESAFGSLSQLVRTEDVAAVGGGLDPFILPLHETFLTRILIPRMSEYYDATCKGAEASARQNAVTPGDARVHNKPSTPATVTVDILECFNSLASRRRHGGSGSSGADHNGNEVCDANGDAAVKKKKKKERKPKKLADEHISFGVDDVHFTVADLPGLVKYLLYFSQRFEVHGGGTTLKFTPHRG